MSNNKQSFDQHNSNYEWKFYTKGKGGDKRLTKAERKAHFEMRKSRRNAIKRIAVEL